MHIKHLKKCVGVYIQDYRRKMVLHSNFQTVHTNKEFRRAYLGALLCHRLVLEWWLSSTDSLVWFHRWNICGRVRKSYRQQSTGRVVSHLARKIIRDRTSVEVLHNTVYG